MKNKESIINAIPFPVFAADANGFITYKNRAAIRYIGKMRKGSRVRRYFSNEIVPQSETVATLRVSTPYPNVLTVSDETESLFLCFSRLQYPDAALWVEDILDTYGRTPADIFQTFESYRNALGKCRKFPSRIYTELLHLIPQERSNPSTAASDFGNLIPTLFEESRESFSALGFRIQAEIDERFMGNAPAKLEYYDLLFFYSRILYGMMKLSRNGMVSISLTTEKDDGCHLFRFYTQTDRKLSRHISSLPKLFCEIAYECAAELFLMGYSEHFEKNTSVFFDLHGGCTVEYRIPCLSPSFSVHSNIVTEDIAAAWEREALRISALFKGIPSFCRYSSAAN